jgi:AAA domain
VLAINAGHQLPPPGVVVFDEAGIASTRVSERLLAHAAEVGAKVIAIGDPGQLASVQAGGWARMIGERLGAVHLTEVMRQRDPAERLALAALHDGAPARRIERATQAGRVEVVPDRRGVLGQAVGECAAGVALPTVELAKLDALDARTRELSERGEALPRDLDRLPEPRERRFGRTEDPHLVDRTRLASALGGAEDQLEHALTECAALARELGDPAYDATLSLI